MKEQSKITDICTIFYLVFKVFFFGGGEIKIRSHMWTNRVGLSVPAGMYKDDVFFIPSLQSFRNYAFEVSGVAICRRRESVVAGKRALPTRRFCRNEHPNDVLLWDRLSTELRRQKLTITDTVSIVLNTQEGRNWTLFH
jgi:hypothetical protein